MVVWKGEIGRSHGQKAFNLDNTGLEVPNFFVITSEEIENLFNTKNSKAILNKSIKLGEIKEAYKDVGMSSEVRNASSRARNLVGGQRDTTKVSIRASDASQADYQLDVGSSDLADAIKKVVSSHFESGAEEHPNLIVQKMIEPEYTGALIKGKKDYIEIVEGLGVPLEDGTTNPTRYKVGENELKDEKIPETQLKVTRNPMTGEYRNRELEDPEPPFERSEIMKLSEKTEKSIKFVYKRGSFFIVDRFEAKQYSETLEYVQVTPGEIQGVIGKDIKLSEQTLSPENYQNTLISRKGGYTSNDAKKARKAGKKAIFGYETAKKGQKIGENRENQENRFNAEKTQTMIKNSESSSTPVTSVKTIEELERSFEPEQHYLTTYAEIFNFDAESAIVDGRRLEKQAITPALEYIDGEITILLEDINQEVLNKAVKKDFSLGVPRGKIKQFENALDLAEREFILENLRKKR